MWILSLLILICVAVIVASGVVQAWLLLRCSWQLPPPVGKHTVYNCICLHRVAQKESHLPNFHQIRMQNKQEKPGRILGRTEFDLIL